MCDNGHVKINFPHLTKLFLKTKIFKNKNEKISTKMSDTRKKR